MNTSNIHIDASFLSKSACLEWVVLRRNFPNIVLSNKRQLAQNIIPDLRHFAEEEQGECCSRNTETSADCPVGVCSSRGEAHEVRDVLCSVEMNVSGHFDTSVLLSLSSNGLANGVWGYLQRTSDRKERCRCCRLVEERRSEGEFVLHPIHLIAPVPLVSLHNDIV